jgi:hypothetical protein
MTFHILDWWWQWTATICSGFTVACMEWCTIVGEVFGDCITCRHCRRYWRPQPDYGEHVLPRYNSMYTTYKPTHEHRERVSNHCPPEPREPEVPVLRDHGDLGLPQNNAKYKAAPEHLAGVQTSRESQLGTPELPLSRLQTV